VVLDALPLTPNGKVDRKALPAPDATGVQEESYIAPRTPIEEGLAEIWCAVLHVERIGVHDNFFELGGHSLLATQVMSRVRNTFQVDLPLHELFDAPTIAGLAVRIAGSSEEGGSGGPSLVRVSREGRLPLSFAQQRLWFIDQLEPQSSLYNLPMALRLGGVLDVVALQQALNAIVERHEALRTTFACDVGQPHLVIHTGVGVGLSVVDLSHLDAQDREDEARRRIAEEARRPFDLSVGPLFRCGLLRLDDTENVLLLTQHHIVSDGWSHEVIRRELSELYNAFVEGRPSPLPNLPIQYADYAFSQREWIQGKVTETQLSYWQTQLKSAAFGLPIRTDRPERTDPTFERGIQYFSCDASAAQVIESLAQQERSSLFIVLLTVFDILLYQDSRQEDICIGTPVSGRRWAETEGLIGLFLNTLVIRSDLSGNPSIRELIRQVRDTVLAAHAHQDLPFEQLVDALKPQRDLSHTPLFRVWFTVSESSPTAMECNGLSITNMSSVLPFARYPLRMNISHLSDGLRGSVSYQTDLFDFETIQRLVKKMEVLLAAVCSDVDLSLKQIVEGVKAVDRQSRNEQRRRLDEDNIQRLGARTRTILHS
jgi:acyl carrier protein